MLWHLHAASAREEPTKRAAGVTHHINASKAKAARDVMSGFAESSSHGRRLLDHSSQLVKAYIELAELKQEKMEQGQTYPLTRLLKTIRWSQDESVMQIPTSEDRAETVGSFEGWSYPGGITKPKKITCKSTDGHNFLQLVKGGEDPRADSVTSQLFCVINVLLKSNQKCRQRKLEVRTYKVIPLHNQV